MTHDLERRFRRKVLQTCETVVCLWSLPIIRLLAFVRQTFGEAEGSQQQTDGCHWSFCPGAKKIAEHSR
jgi:hypothetical protein